MGAAVVGVLGLLIAGLVGVVIGTVGKLLMPWRDPGGWLVTILLAVGGGWVGASVLAALGLPLGGVTAVVAAVIGATVLLATYRLLKGM